MQIPSCVYVDVSPVFSMQELNLELAKVPAVVAMLRSVRDCFAEKRRGICKFRHWTSV